MARIRLKGRSKYNARKTTVDGIVFHSAKEARRYGELKQLEKAGEIEGLILQPRFDLSVPWYMGGNNAVVGSYVADFQYFERQPAETGLGTRHERVVEDVKGFKTPLYRWKKKHVEAQYGIQIREI